LTEKLLEALEASDGPGSRKAFRDEIRKGRDAWQIHLSLFPVVQRVLNPPFINAHLPKMYSICRDLAAYLKKEEIPALVELEINEYARKPLMDKLSRRDSLTSPVSFRDVESAIHEGDQEKTTVLMSTFFEQNGAEELARRFLLLGSGYLGDSLGHSISSPAFIFLELMERPDQDPWPALVTLSDFFCRSHFHTTPSLVKSAGPVTGEAMRHHVIRATGGRGIINMHNTITRYAIGRARRIFSKREYDHMTASWIGFMANSSSETAQDNVFGEVAGQVNDYDRFYEIFSALEPKPVVSALRGLIPSREGRRKLGRFLVKSLCNQYQGHYDPHYLTGLGSALWTLERYWNQPPIPSNALFQYLDFYFDSLTGR
jgi:hypothetical protein